MQRVSASVSATPQTASRASPTLRPAPIRLSATEPVADVRTGSSVLMFGATAVLAPAAALPDALDSDDDHLATDSSGIGLDTSVAGGWAPAPGSARRTANDDDRASSHASGTSSRTQHSDRLKNRLQAALCGTNKQLSQLHHDLLAVQTSLAQIQERAVAQAANPSTATPDEADDDEADAAVAETRPAAVGDAVLVATEDAERAEFHRELARIFDNHALLGDSDADAAIADAEQLLLQSPARSPVFGFQNSSDGEVGRFDQSDTDTDSERDSDSLSSQSIASLPSGPARGPMTSACRARARVASHRRRSVHD